MKKVLLTGAAGFVGRHCLGPLHKKGFKIHAVHYRHKPLTVPFKVTWHRTDLMNKNAVKNLVAKVKPTHLLHLAWCTVPGDYETSHENIRWMRASKELFEIFSSHGGKRAVVVGTCMEGYSKNRTLYAKSKRQTARAYLAWAKKYKISVAWARLFYLYGPHEHPRRLVASTIQLLLKRRAAVCRYGDYRMDFSHIEDVARALVKLLASRSEGVMDVASGDSPSLRQITTLIAGKLGCLEKLTVKNSSRQTIAADVTRLRGELRWRPKYNLSRGLDTSIHWWKKGNSK